MKTKSTLKEKNANDFLTHTKREEGITLVVLIITIISLVILATVTIRVVIKNNFIGIATKGTENYAKGQVEETDRMDDLVGYLDEATAKIQGGETEVDDGIEVRYTISGNDEWSKTPNNISIAVVVQNNKGELETGTIKIIKNGTDITNSTEIKSDGTFTLSVTEAEETIFEVTAKTSEGKQSEPRIIKVIPKVDVEAPIVDSVTATTNGMKIIISATGSDSKSGIKEFNYTITPKKVTSDSKATGTFEAKETAEVTTKEEGEYTITVTATDNAQNVTANEGAKTYKVTTTDGGVSKYINLTTGKTLVNTRELYGATVTEYNCTREKVEWQIFYVDNYKDHTENEISQVYLITKNTMVPPTKGTELVKSGDSKYPRAYIFTDAVLDKNKTDPNNTIQDTRFTRKYLSEYVGYKTSSRINLQATRYMLDQSIWEEYKMTDKTEFAFGGPTLPLFQASYNDICKITTRLGIKKSSYGYNVNVGGDTYSSGKTGYGDGKTQKGIYFKGTSASSSQGIWLSSPSNGQDITTNDTKDIALGAATFDGKITRI